MTIVDTSVWIEYFRGKNRTVTDRVDGLLKPVNVILMCGQVLQEILQGIRNDREYNRVFHLLDRLPFYRTQKDDYIRAGEIYRKLRKRGITVPAADALIAALSGRNQFTLYTVDPHFIQIRKVIPLNS